MQGSKLQLVLGGLVLFSSGVLLGGYVLWSQQTAVHRAIDGSSKFKPIFNSTSSSKFNVNTDSTVPPVAPMAYSTKSAPVFTGEPLRPDVVGSGHEFDPETMRMMTSKSAAVFSPEDLQFGAPTTESPVAAEPIELAPTPQLSPIDPFASPNEPPPTPKGKAD